jgi:hypothetical protein
MTASRLGLFSDPARRMLMDTLEGHSLYHVGEGD